MLGWGMVWCGACVCVCVCAPPVRSRLCAWWWWWRGGASMQRRTRPARDGLQRRAGGHGGVGTGSHLSGGSPPVLKLRSGTTSPRWFCSRGRVTQLAQGWAAMEAASRREQEGPPPASHGLQSASPARTSPQPGRARVAGAGAQPPACLPNIPGCTKHQVGKQGQGGAHPHKGHLVAHCSIQVLLLRALHHLRCEQGCSVGHRGAQMAPAVAPAELLHCARTCLRCACRALLLACKPRRAAAGGGACSAAARVGTECAPPAHPHVWHKLGP